MNKNSINILIIDLSGILGVIFQFIQVPIFIKIIITSAFALALIYYIYSFYIEHRKYSREKRIETVINFISNSRNRIVFFAGNLSWVNDYRDTIQVKISNGCSVDVYYDNNTNFSDESIELLNNRISELESIGCNVYKLDDCYSLRCIISDANNESNELKGIIIKKVHEDTNPAKNKYKINKFDFKTEHTMSMLFYDLNKILIGKYDKEEVTTNGE